MKTQNIENIYQLSPMQKGMHFHSLYDSTSGVYFNQVVWRIEGNLDRAAFTQAWEYVIQRHAILRTSFHWEGLKEPLQVVHKQIKPPITYHDWQQQSQPEQDTQLVQFLQADQHQGFELTQAPLMRITLVQIAPASHLFVWSRHHILLDGWSQVQVLKEVFMSYEYAATYKQHAVDLDLILGPVYAYATYIDWLQQQDQQAAEQYWRHQLGAIQQPTPLLPAWQFANRQHQPQDTQEQGFKLDQAATTRLQAMLAEAQLTLNTLFQGLWALLLSQHSQQNEVVFGITVSGRPTELPGIETMVGLFINTLPTRINVPATGSLFDWLAHIQHEQLELRHYEYCALVDIQGWSGIPRTLPLFDSIVVFENYPVANTASQQQSSIQLHYVRSNIHNNLPLTFRILPGASISIELMYNRNLIRQSTITEVLDLIQHIVDHIIQAKDVDLSTIKKIMIDKTAHYQQQNVQRSKQASSNKLKNLKRRSVT